MRNLVAPASGLALLAAGACSSDTPKAPEPPATTIATPPAEANLDWSVEGLDAQPRMKELQQRASASPGYTPASTPWRAVASIADYALKDSARYATPGSFLSALVLSLGFADGLGDATWEQTIRVWLENDDSAVGVALLWGIKDDAVAGRDLRVHLRRANNVWHAERVEERFHCRRKVDASGSCS